MPHDANGAILQPGDQVLIRGRVLYVGSDPANAQYCNLTVELDRPMPAYPDQKTTFSGLNASQVEKVQA